MATQTELQTNQAIELFDYGFHPLLLGTSGQSLKKPILKAWQKTVFTRDEVETWPIANNKGIRGGLMRDGRYLYVFDFDMEASTIFPQWFKEALTIIPYMVVVETNRGFHVYVITDDKQAHGNIATDESGKGVLIEIRGDGQNIVAAGSLHPSGKRYRFIAGESYANVPHISTNEYRYLFDLAQQFDRSPKKKTVKPVAKRQPLPAKDIKDAHSGPHDKGSFRQTATINLQGINCLSYARAHIDATERLESDGQYRFLGNGGLLITADGNAFYSFADDIGGNIVDLVAWHQGISKSMAAKWVREANKPAVAEENKQDDVKDLANELWQDSTMAIAGRDHFDDSDRLPHEWVYPHTCNNYMEGRTDENDNVIKKRHTAKLWRARVIGVNSRFDMEACPGCQHDIAVRFFKQLEYECGAYEDVPFRWQIMPAMRAKKFIREARAAHGADLRYWRMPLRDDRVVIIHNATYNGKILKRYIKGKAHNLPLSELKAYELIKRWVEDVSLTGNVSHSQGWGGDWQGVKGDGRTKVDEENSEDEPPVKSKIHFITDYDEAQDAVCLALNVKRLPQNTGVHIVKFLDILDDAGVKYGVQSGHDELKALRQNSLVHMGKKETVCTKLAQKLAGVQKRHDMSNSVGDYAYKNMREAAKERRKLERETT